jgi:hypothetical protein
MKAQSKTMKKGYEKEQEIRIDELAGMSSGVINITGGDQVSHEANKIETAGGDYIAGNISTGGGDFIGRDNASILEILDGGAQAASQALTQDLSIYPVSGGAAGEQLFSLIYRQIQLRPLNPDVEKEEIVDTVRRIQQEIAKGEPANPSKVERWLYLLQSIAPDVFETTSSAMLNPALILGGEMRAMVAALRSQSRAA